MLNTQELGPLWSIKMQFVLAVDLKSHNQNVIEAQTSSLKSRLKGFVFCFFNKTENLA